MKNAIENKPIRTIGDAIAYLEAHGAADELTTDKRGREGFIISDQCYRCGGSGYLTWTNVDGGRCFACCGANTTGLTKFIDVKTTAQKLKRSLRARAKREALAVERAASQLDSQRAWCDANGHGRLTFDELDAKRNAERAALRGVSQHVGDIGERVEFHDLQVVARPTWETNYGLTYCYIMVDSDGNKYVWKASNPPSFEVEFPADDSGPAWTESVYADKGDTVSIKATVKEHGEREGERQTIVTRAKLISASRAA